MRRTIVLLMVVLCLCASRAKANLTLADGGTHDVSNFVSGDINVLDGPGPTSTTLNLLSGSEVENDVLAIETSRVNVYDGLINGRLEGRNDTLVNVYGGQIDQELQVRGGSLVNVYGGQMQMLGTRNYSVANVYDGLIVELDSRGHTVVNVYGGSMSEIDAHGASEVNIYSGSILDGLYPFEEGLVNIYGGSILDGLFPSGDSRINIYGGGFNYPYGPIMDISGTLTGTLNSGESINWYFERLHASSIYLIPAPGAILLGGIGIGLVGWLRRRRTL